MKNNIFREKNFLLLSLGNFISIIGSDMQSFILSLYVLKITGSATKFASVLAMTIIPKVFLAPFAGVLADRIDKKKAIVLLDILSGISVGAFAYIYKTNNGLSMLSIYILVILLSLISLLFNPSITALIPAIVNKEDLPQANSIIYGTNKLASVLAPTIGAALFSIFGLFSILVINSSSFILSAVSEMFIFIPKNDSIVRKLTIRSFFQDFREGINFIINSKLISSIIIFAILVNFAGTPMFGLVLTYILKQVIHVTDFQLGTLETILIGSMLISPFISSYISKKFRLTKILYSSVFFIGINTILISFVCSPIYINTFKSNFIPYITMIILGAIVAILIGINGILMGTILQQEVPKSMIGRVASVMGSFAVAATPLGQMIFGVLLDRIAVYSCVIIVSIILIFAALMFRKYSKPVSASDQHNTHAHSGDPELV